MTSLGQQARPDQPLGPSADAYVRPGPPSASAQAADITRGDDQSHGRVDRPPDHRCLPLERSARLSHSRPRRILRSRSDQPSFCHGHPRSPDGPAVTLAEWACGETNRFDPPGVPRSHRRLWRGPSAPDPCGLQRLLQRTPNTSVPGEGYARRPAGPAVRPGHRAVNPGRTSSSVWPDVVFSRDSSSIELPVCYSASSLHEQNR